VQFGARIAFHYGNGAWGKKKRTEGGGRVTNCYRAERYNMLPLDAITWSVVYNKIHPVKSVTASIGEITLNRQRPVNGDGATTVR
jgi:hypothetical protein